MIQLSDTMPVDQYTNRRRRRTGQPTKYRTKAVYNLNRDPGEVSLLTAVVEQAIADWFLLIRAGIIKDGKPTGYFPQRVHGGDNFQGMTPNDVKDLIKFFKGRDLETVLDAACVSVDTKLIRRGMSRCEREGRYT